MALINLDCVRTLGEGIFSSLTLRSSLIDGAIARSACYSNLHCMLSCKHMKFLIVTARFAKVNEQVN